jgi:uncharacterized membrane protein YozB (DUF420 family)
MAWFFLTIVVPLLAPFALVPAFWMLSRSTDAKIVVLAKDGQLCWVSMGFCVAGLYDIAERVVSTHKDYNSSSATTLFISLVIFLVFSAILAAGGAVFPTSLGVPQGVAWHRHYLTLVISSIFTLLAAIGYTVVHFALALPSC